MIPNNGLGEGHDAIIHALTIDDHFALRQFLDDWSHGDLEEWPEYRQYLAKIYPSNNLAEKDKR